MGKSRKNKKKRTILFVALYLAVAAGVLFILRENGLDAENVVWLCCAALVFLVLLLIWREFRYRLEQKRRAKDRRLRKIEKPTVPQSRPERKKQSGGVKSRFGGKRSLVLAAALVVCVIAAAIGYSWHQRRSIPASLISFKERYPEAAEFVDHYPDRKKRREPIDLSSEVVQGTIPLFIQWDERWGYETYGSDLLALTGCGPTCLSMILCGLTGETTWNPYEVAKYSEEKGYYVPGEGTSWELMTTGAQNLGLQASYAEISESSIRSNLEAGNPLICSMYPGDFTTSGHFIVLTGLDENGAVIVNDPNSRINSEKHWTMDVLLPQIRSVWVYWL